MSTFFFVLLGFNMAQQVWLASDNSVHSSEQEADKHEDILRKKEEMKRIQQVEERKVKLYAMWAGLAPGRGSPYHNVVKHVSEYNAWYAVFKDDVDTQIKAELEAEAAEAEAKSELEAEAESEADLEAESETKGD